MADSKQEVLRNVLVLAIADGKVTEQEKEFILGLRERLGIDKDEFAALVEEVRRDRTAAPLPTEPGEALEAILTLAKMAAADGRITDRERSFFRKLAAQVGMDEAEADSLLLTPEQVEELSSRADGILEDIYEKFAGWDPARRSEKIAELASLGRGAIVPLLQLLESYRTPDGAPDALELKILVCRQIGLLGDARAVYYLAQQVTLGDTDDEITNAALRSAAAEALGKLVGQAFTPDQAGVDAARQWWVGPGRRQFGDLMI